MSDATEYKGIPKLMAVTYAAWKCAITMALMSERSLDIIEYRESQPEPPTIIEEEADPEAKQEYS